MILGKGQLFEFLRKYEEYKERHGSYPLKLNKIKLNGPKKKQKRIAFSKE